MIDTVHGGGCVGVHDRYCTLGGCGGYMIDTVHWGAVGVHDRYCTLGAVGGTCE